MSHRAAERRKITHSVIHARSAVLSIITGGGKWVEMAIHADPLYQHLLITAERKFWRCVQSGETPSPIWRRAAPAAPGKRAGWWI
jgi:hypothetical protein